MDQLAHLPILALAPAIFFCRVLDVSIGTLRTISVVQGRTRLAVALGFFEVLLWVAAVSQVMARLDDSPLLLVAYAGGFATGNAIGIALDRRLALGNIVVRLITHGDGPAMAEALRAHGQAVTTFEGLGRDGPVSMLWVVCARRAMQAVIDTARQQDPEVFFASEPVAATRTGAIPIPQDTGWRAILKKK